MKVKRGMVAIPMSCMVDDTKHRKGHARRMRNNNRIVDVVNVVHVDWDILKRKELCRNREQDQATNRDQRKKDQETDTDKEEIERSLVIMYTNSEKDSPSSPSVSASAKVCSTSVEVAWKPKECQASKKSSVVTLPLPSLSNRLNASRNDTKCDLIFC